MIQASYAARKKESLEPEASALINSGNGIQALWRLETPIALAPPIDGKLSSEAAATIADVEARSKALMERMGAKPGTQNIDRILRLPGTINLPNKKKRKAGRVPCEAQVLRANGAVYSLNSFPPPQAAAEPPQAARQQNKPWSLDALPISDRVRNLIRGIDDPEHPYPSRSERVMAVLVALAGAGYLDEEMRAVIHGYPIGDHVREQSDPEKYLDRQIARARQMAIDPDVAKLNEKYALVIVGDKTAVLTTGAKGIKFLTISAFEQWLANRFIRRGNKRVSLAKYWLSHPQRRQYEGVVFAPGRVVANHYNLWKGFAAEPRPGDCSKFLAHVRDNVCRGNENLYHWVIGWFAQIFQHPDKKIGTSLVLRGPQGVGKTKVGEVIGSLLGEHYKLVSDPRYITGRFNSHLADCLLLHADEAFWAGDHAAEGKLKDLITGHDHFIEYKGKEPVRVQNFVRLLVTGNDDWLVPAGLGERRPAVLDVGQEHMQDHAYFAAIDAEMANGGREALLQHLLNFDLSTVDLRSIPKTAALLDQKVASLPSEKAWWLDVLMRGKLPLGCGRTCPTAELFDDYITHADKIGVRRRAIETQIGMFLSKHVPGLRKSEGRYEFPPLAEARAAFAKKLQHTVDWGDENEWRAGIPSRHLPPRGMGAKP